MALKIKQKWFKSQSLFCAALFIIALHGETFALSNKLNGSIESQKDSVTGQTNKIDRDKLKPRKIKNFKQLKRLLASRKVHSRNHIMMTSGLGDNAVFNAAPTAEGGAIEHSETNVQVEGVDEGDIVKTDGGFIYAIQNGKVRIIKAYPATAMANMATLEFDIGFSPNELYINGKQLIVIGSGWQAHAGSNTVPVLKQNGKASLGIWAPSGESRTLAKVYDITDSTKPTLLREVAFSGNYLSSRKIGNNVYMIGRKYPNYYFRYFLTDPAGTDQNAGITRDNSLPHISDSAVKDGEDRTLPIANIYFFPKFVEPDYVIVAGFKLDALNQKADVKAYLGGGDITYASGTNLYISAADYNYSADVTSSAPFTHLYKFALDQGSINFSSAGEVPGLPLNQFSMDEHNSYFRIATTVDKWTQTGDNFTSETWNNLYTLDSNMNIAGRLEHMAEGERIFSTRFMGDRAYMVTFRQVDPLFVLDLSIPQAPIVMGELKIPGFSNYLHPFDENHIIGFGQDTEDNGSGVVTSGMKLALFDVTDVTNPTQMHSLTIGKQGSYSELLYNHKALLFDKKRSLIGFPVSITDQKPGETWPSEVFQGAYVYQVSLADGFQQKAAITHQQDGQQYDWLRYVQRLLTIGNELYTLSETKLQANDMTAFNLTGTLDFPIEQPPIGCGYLSSGTSNLAELTIDCPIYIDPIETTINLN